MKVDLIVGLPGDTVESVRRGLHYLHDNGFNEVQVFNLAVLPGTAFRHEAASLGLKYQPRPPYYVLNTPTLAREDLYGLMQEAQDLFEVEFDAQPPPMLDFPAAEEESRVWRVDLDAAGCPCAPPEARAQAFTLWLRSAHFDRKVGEAAALVRGLLADNPYTTLQVVLEPSGTIDVDAVRRRFRPALLEALIAVCQETPTYLDKFYGLQPGALNGAKRLILLLPMALRPRLGDDWLENVAACSTVVWRGPVEHVAEEMEAHEYAWAE